MRAGAAVPMLVAAALVLCGCPERRATVKVQLANIAPGPTLSALIAPTPETPTAFGMKIVSAFVTAGYYVQDGTALVYLNPQCGEDYTHCAISTTTDHATDDGRPISHVVTDYFELVDPTAANAALNAQSREIEPQTYHLVRVDFCHTGDPSVGTVQWSSPSVPTLQSVNAGCANAELPLDPPLEVEAGDSIVIQLSYDLTNAVTAGSSTPVGNACVGSGPYDCITVPTFTVSALKQ